MLNSAATQASTARPSSVSRDWELKTAANGVHYSIGGKLTSARQEATKIVDRVCNALNIQTPCTTQTHLFPWYPQQVADFDVWSQNMQQQAEQAGVDTQSAFWLIRRHGVKVADILQTIAREPALAERIIPSAPLIYADLTHCAQHEMAVHLDDILRRRVPLLILTKMTPAVLNRIVDRIAGILHWDSARCEQEISRCSAQLNP